MNRTAKHTSILLILLMLCALLLPGAIAEGGAAISGCAYVDQNQNLICDEGEQLMTGLPVRLYVQDGEKWQEQAAAETDEYGRYSFEGLEPGVYCVRSSTTAEGYAVLAVGETALPAADGSGFESEAFTVTAAESFQADVSLGQAAVLEVLVFEDRNSDSKVSKYDEGIKGVTVEVLDGVDDSGSPENGQGKFYVLHSFCDKLIADAHRFMEGTEIVVNSKN